jgi:sulfide:quinone oxidoreductase
MAFETNGSATRRAPDCDVLIVGGGASGIAAAASLRRRRPKLRITVVEPSDLHHYQPGWTLVGGGVLDPCVTRRPTASTIPPDVQWLQTSATTFHPQTRQVRLATGGLVSYRVLVVATGLKLDWGAIPGLAETLGRNGVTSNYRGDLAPYTWRLVRELRSGCALFTQPPMPIKCAGAPQKALYLAADHWRRTNRLNNLEVAFHNAGPALFGVADFVPALMEYIRRCGVDLRLSSRLTAIDGPRRVATFVESGPEGTPHEVSRAFDMIHVCPPQCAPDVIRDSPLADAAGWADVDPATLRHRAFEDVFALGDAASTPNAKTAAAARKQAPVIAENVLATLEGRPLPAAYDGYGACPLTVERGRIVLAEFGYGNRLLPTFPNWLVDGRKPTRAAWALKTKILPFIYWNAMLKGREWLASPGRASS